MDRRPVVCHMVEDLTYGGVEELVRVIVTNTPQDQYRVVVLVLEEGGVTAERIREAGIPLEILGIKSYHRLSSLRKIADFLIREKVDIIHAHMYFANMAARWANLLAKRPVVITTAYSTYYEKKLHQRMMEFFWAPFTDCIIAAAEVIKNFMAQQSWIKPSKFRVIYDAAADQRQLMFDAGESRESLRKALALKESDFVIACVARLAPVKGHVYLLQAFKLLHKTVPNAVLILAGDGPEEYNLKKQARALGVSDYVRFVGMSREVWRVLGAADVFALVSHLREGCPLSVLEAMSMELPVVGTRIGGIPEEVEDGVTGSIVPPCNATAIACALEKWHHDENMRRQMGQAGRSRYESLFAPQVMIRQICDLYAESLNHKASASGN